jgi:hypothetical protein
MFIHCCIDVATPQSDRTRTLSSLRRTPLLQDSARWSLLFARPLSVLASCPLLSDPAKILVDDVPVRLSKHIRVCLSWERSWPRWSVCSVSCLLATVSWLTRRCVTDVKVAASQQSASTVHHRHDVRGVEPPVARHDEGTWYNVLLCGLWLLAFPTFFVHVLCCTC